MNSLELLLMLSVSTAVTGYGCYVIALVVRADFYSIGQKFAQLALIFVLPIFGAFIGHRMLGRKRRYVA
jgi:hypothetical protein